MVNAIKWTEFDIFLYSTYIWHFWCKEGHSTKTTLMYEKIASFQCCVIIGWAPHVGSGVERIDPLRFVAGCRKRKLNQALSVLSLNLVLLSVSVVLLTRATFWVVLFCVVCVFRLLFVLVRLSVSVQVIDWKNWSSKWRIMCCWDVKPYSLIRCWLGNRKGIWPVKT